jgi:hypothetical protein
MSFVIMNFADEVLCVDGLGKVKVKPLSVVQSSDCILFKIIDLTDITNPGELHLLIPSLIGRCVFCCTFPLWRIVQRLLRHRITWHFNCEF